MTIAGSDSSGGAGIQADLKTISAHGLYGTSALTAITAQNTLGVTAVLGVPPTVIVQQIEAILSDIPTQAIKIGMVGDAERMMAIVDVLLRYPDIPVVVDPVMVATSGSKLSDVTEVAAWSALFKCATVITPNLPEAEFLLQKTIKDRAHMVFAAEDLARQYDTAVLLKGGHLTGCAEDCLCQDGKISWHRAPFVETTNTHGTGCTLSAAIACHLAMGKTLSESVDAAKVYLSGALSTGLNMGAGSGPVDHLWQQFPLSTGSCPSTNR